MSEFHHGHEPRAEEIALHQKYLTLDGQIDAARLEGNEAEVRRLTPARQASQDALDQGQSQSHSRELERGVLMRRIPRSRTDPQVAS